MTEFLIVDGYNIVYQWELLAQMDSLDDARDKLVTMLSSYAGYKGYTVIIVFDAHSRVGGDEVWEQLNSHVHIVFTKQGETADTVIERLVHDMVGEQRIYVATSDKDEQYFVLTKGAVRLSARELILDVEKELRDINSIYLQTPRRQKTNTLWENMDLEVQRKLERIRRQR